MSTASLHRDAAGAVSRGEWSKAIKALSTDRSITTKSASLSTRAFCYYKLELYKHALKDAEKALAVDPSFVLAYLRKGQSLAALDRANEATEAWLHGLAVALEREADLELCLQFDNLIKQHLPLTKPSRPPSYTSSLPESPPESTPDQIGKGAVTAPPTSPAIPLASPNGNGHIARELHIKPDPMLASPEPAPASAAVTTPSPLPLSAPAPSAAPLSSSAAVATPSAAPVSSSAAVTTPSAASLSPSAVAAAPFSSSPSPSAASSLTQQSAPGARLQANGTSSIFSIKFSSPAAQVPPAADKPFPPAAAPPAAQKQPSGRVSLDESLSLAARRLGLESSTPEASSSLKKKTKNTTTSTAAAERRRASATAGYDRPPSGWGGSMARMDFRVSLGISQVNAGHFQEAIMEFDKVIEENKHDAGAYIGRGTAYALQHKLDRAIADFTRAIDLDPNTAEAWKRRAQARGNKALTYDVIDDFTQALRLDPRALECHHERGLVYLKLREYTQAIQDLRAVVAIDPSNKAAYNYLGLSLVALGEPLEGVKAYQKAIQVDGTFREAYANMGQAYRELADVRRAAESFQRALEIDISYGHAKRLWGLMKHGMGDHRGALQVLDASLEKDPSYLEVKYIRGSCHHALGNYSEAKKDYDDCLGMPTSDEGATLIYLAYYQREISLYTASKHHLPLHAFNLDGDLPPFFKEAWCKKLPPTMLFPAYTQQPACSPNKRRKKELTAAQQLARAQLAEAADTIGRRIQNNCPGFLPNVRQHRMAGLAALEISQLVSATWQAMREGREFFGQPEADTDAGAGAGGAGGGSKAAARRARRKGSPTPGGGARGGGGSSSNRGGSTSTSHGASSASTSFSAAGASASANAERDGRGKGAPAAAIGRITGWRDVYNLAVRWRQLAEPNDPVVWVDLLTEKEFVQGFGSHTPLLLGQAKVVRYYTNFPRALRIMKEQILEKGGVTNAANKFVSLALPEQRRAVEEAKDCKALYDVVGADFWVTTPCHSTAKPRNVLDGTRLTLQKTKTGYDFSIRTPGTPPRWLQYDYELTAAWEELCSLMCIGDGAVDGAERLAQIRTCILRLSYYWYNFMPLARGTAVVGYVVLLALFLAASMEVTAPIPRGIQVDWEAILSPSLDMFVQSVGPWLGARLKHENAWRGLSPVCDVVGTVGGAISLLSEYEV